MPRRRPPGIAIPVCQAGSYHRGRYDHRSTRQILPRPLFLSPRFRCSVCKSRASSSHPRSSFQSGPNIEGRQMPGSDREIRQIALQASPRQNGLSYAAAIDSSHAPFDRSTTTIYANYIYLYPALRLHTGGARYAPFHCNGC